MKSKVKRIMPVNRRLLDKQVKALIKVINGKRLSNIGISNIDGLVNMLGDLCGVLERGEYGLMVDSKAPNTPRD